MKSIAAFCFSLVIATSFTLNAAQAREEGKGQKGKGPAAGRPENPGNAQQLRNRARQGFGGGPGAAAQMAQMMIAQFDRNGDAALDAAELTAAMNALMQRMQLQMRQQQGMGQGIGPNSPRGQGPPAGRGGRGGRGGGAGGGAGGRGGGR